MFPLFSYLFQPFCSLHLHLQVSENPYTSGSISSKETVPGLLVATGTDFVSAQSFSPFSNTNLLCTKFQSVILQCLKMTHRSLFHLVGLIVSMWAFSVRKVSLIKSCAHHWSAVFILLDQSRCFLVLMYVLTWVCRECFLGKVPLEAREGLFGKSMARILSRFCAYSWEPESLFLWM